MRTIFLALVMLVMLTGVTLAQEVSNDRVKIFAGFTNVNIDLPVANEQGFTGAVQLKLYGYEGVKLEAVGDFTAVLSADTRVYGYLGGPQVGINLFHGRFNPFARIMFGVARAADTNFYAHSIGGGLDVNVTKRVAVRALQYDHVSVEGTLPIKRISTGVVLKF